MQADVVSDSETDSSKNSNMQTQSCNVILNDIRRSQRLNKRDYLPVSGDGSCPAKEKVKRCNTRNVHN